MTASPTDLHDLPYGAQSSMEPQDVLVRYRTEQDTSCELQGFIPGSCSDDAMEVKVAFDGETMHVSALVKQPLTIEFVQVTLRHAFATNENVLMNGYQSWTDTTELPAWGRMRGLRGVPKGLVRRFTLHGGGDYLIVDYTAKRGQQHGFSYATFRRDEGMVLVGSLDEDRGFTLIRTDAAKGQVLLQPECPKRVLPAGAEETLGRFAITRGLLDDCYDRWFELSGITARPVRPLIGYTSWYRHYGAITQEKLLADLDGMQGYFEIARKNAGAADVDDADLPFIRLFQIDDGYCKVGDWLDVDSADFPDGLGHLADRIRQEGMLPGLWLAPFVCERESRLFKEHPDWLLRDEDGQPMPTGPHWSGGVALDTQNVDVRSYILHVLQTMTREWGFGLLKVDFLYAACMMPHHGLNRGELMADAMDLIRTGAGENTLILGCGVPLASAFGRVDYCRIGCDVGLDWDDLPHMRLLHRERVSTKNSLANTYGRAPLDGRAFGNDPDVFFLRPDVRLDQFKRDNLLFADADLGSVLLTSDDMSKWTADMQARHKEAVHMLLSKERRHR